MADQRDTSTPSNVPTTAPTTAPTGATPAPSKVRALVFVPPDLRRGVPAQVRTTLGHPMESGQRRDAMGQAVPQDIVREFEARFDGQLLLAVSLYPAISANPYLAFWLQLDGPATLTLDWRGDHGFAHRETRQLVPV